MSETFQVDVFFNGYRHAVKCTEHVAARSCGIGCRSASECLFGEHSHDRINLWVNLGDALEMRLYYFATRDLALANITSEL